MPGVLALAAAIMTVVVGNTPIVKPFPSISGQWPAALNRVEPRMSLLLYNLNTYLCLSLVCNVSSRPMSARRRRPILYTTRRQPECQWNFHIVQRVCDEGKRCELLLKVHGVRMLRA